MSNYYKSSTRTSVFTDKPGAMPEVTVRKRETYLSLEVKFGANEVTWFIDADVDNGQSVEELVGNLVTALSTIHFVEIDD